MISLQEAQENLNEAMIDAGEEIPTGSHIPQANAGLDENSSALEIRLDASLSSDVDNDNLIYFWTLKSEPLGSTLVLSDVNSSNPAFEAHVDGAYIFSLTVYDGKFTSAPDEVKIIKFTPIIPNTKPTADAGIDQNVEILSLVSLDGSGNDIDGDILSYTWSVVTQPLSSHIVLNDTAISNPSFTPLLDGNYTFALYVSDALSQSLLDTVSVIAFTPNRAPTANAGVDQQVETLNTVTLSGSGSDEDGDTLTYLWILNEKPAGSNLIFLDTSDVNPTFTPDVDGNYSFTLNTNDGILDSLNDSVRIESSTPNRAPTANAGNDQNIETLTLVTLEGSGNDLDGDSLNYLWTLNSRPSGSSLIFNDSTLLASTFTPDVDGNYTFSFTTNDGVLNSLSDSVRIEATTANRAPTANAGLDEIVDVNTTLLLDGNRSSDLDDDSLTYNWIISSKPGSSVLTLLSNQLGSQINFKADVDGDYIVQLIVFDGALSSTTDELLVRASIPNRAPIADAGSNKTVPTASTVSLNGSLSSDLDDDSLIYTWNIVTEPVNSNITLSNINAVQPSFTVLIDGNYTFSLSVNDGLLDSLPDTVEVSATTANLAPVANAGSDQNVVTGSPVVLNASQSNDVDGDSLTYDWILADLPGTSGVLFVSTPLLEFTFTPDVDGNYTFNLTVNDGNLDSEIDTIVIVASTANSAPTANAGIDQEVSTGSVVTLNGIDSSDANEGDTLTYAWSIKTVPSGANISLSDENSSNPQFTAYASGGYVFELMVNDGTLSSSVDEVSITATEDNVAPVANAGINQNVETLFEVTLDASASSDDNVDDNLSYQWSVYSVPSGSGINTLIGDTTVGPTFTSDIDGTYIFNLVVNDGTIDSVDTVDSQVSIIANTANSAPVAHAGSDAYAYVDQNYELNSSLSSDANNDILTYMWSVFSKPADSNVIFSDANTSNSNFSADRSGTYVLQLIVNDGEFDSEISKVSITAISLEYVKKTDQTYSNITGDDGYYQIGAIANYSRSNDIVTDGVSGLMWQDDNPTTYNPIRGDQAAGYCSNLTLGTYSDWRLPKVDELFSIMHRNRNYPSIDSSIFLTMEYRTTFWTATTLGSNDRRYVDFYEGTEKWSSQVYSYSVRCVRGNENTPLVQRDASNGVVIDYQSRLVWQDNTLPSKAEWADSVNYCNALSLNGSDEWRLPNIKELLTVIDFQNTSGVFIGIFQNNPDNAWSSTSNISDVSKAFSVYNYDPTFGSLEEPFISENETKDKPFFSDNRKNPKCVMTLP